jgi:hypothetical protein
VAKNSKNATAVSSAPYSDRSAAAARPQLAPQAARLARKATAASVADPLRASHETYAV